MIFADRHARPESELQLGGTDSQIGSPCFAPTVVKVGGSLFRDLGFAARLRQWIQVQSPRQPLLFIAGGGAVADEIRRFSEAEKLADFDAHWLAIRAMSLQAHLLKSVLPDAVITDDIAFCRTAHDGKANLIFDPFQFLSGAEAPALPASWNVTSDSIAAVVAKSLGAWRLVLLKSVGKGPFVSLMQAVRAGWLDAHFPEVAQGLNLEWTNLREDLVALPLIRE